MNKIYFSKFYKGEKEAPKSLSEKGAFFWDYEKAYYETNPNPTEEEFENWLEDLLRNYLPYKMMSGPLANEEEAYQEWKREYENS